jgi:methyl-accepting chemotaxis protein
VFVSEVEKRLDQKFSSRIDEISRKIESVLSVIEERRQWEKVRQEIENTVRAYIEPMAKSLSDVVSKVENSRSWDQIRKEIEEMVKKHTESLATTLAPRRESPPEVAEIRSRVDAILSRLEQIEQKQKDEKLEKIDAELRDLKKYIDDRFTRISIAPPESKTPPTEAAMVTISEKLRELNELVSNIKNAKETIESMMRELGTSPEAEKVRSELEALRMRIRELEEKTSMTKAIGDLVADPRKLRDMVGLFREIAEEINKLRSSIPQPQQAQTPVVTVTRPPPLKTFIGGESGGSGEAGGASQGAVQGEAGQGQG